MFDIGSSELLVIVIVAIVVVGPKDLPKLLYKIGQVLGKARSMSRHFRSGIDAMIREVELEEMEKKWSAENRRIIEQNAQAGADPSEQQNVLAAPNEGQGAEGDTVIAPAGEPDVTVSALPASQPVDENPVDDNSEPAASEAGKRAGGLDV